MFEPSRSDSPLLIRALQHGWKIPAAMREKVVAVLCEITSDPKAKPRERTAAARALLQASRVDLDAIRAAQEAQYGDLIQRLRALEERADGGLGETAGGDRPAGAASGPPPG
jgi:hypothetical protein